MDFNRSLTNLRMHVMNEMKQVNPNVVIVKDIEYSGMRPFPFVRDWKRTPEQIQRGWK